MFGPAMLPPGGASIPPPLALLLSWLVLALPGVIIADTFRSPPVLVVLLSALPMWLVTLTGYYPCLVGDAIAGLRCPLWPVSGRCYLASPMELLARSDPQRSIYCLTIREVV